MDDTQLEVGGRRTSDEPTEFMQNGQMPSGWGEPIGEEKTPPRPDSRAHRVATDSQSLAQHERRSNFNEKVDALATLARGKVGANRNVSRRMGD